jgi:hypothetical protein
MVLRLRRAQATIGSRDAGAAALIREFGVGAYSEARRREREASSEAIASDWSRVAMKVARLAGGLIDGVDRSPGKAAPQTDQASDDPEQSRLATQPFRIQFIGYAPGRKTLLLDELRIEASNRSAAIIAAACAAWPPKTQEQRILDLNGRQVFERRAGREPPGGWLGRLARDLPGGFLANS